MLTIIQNPYGAWLIWGCIIVVLIVAFGNTIFHKLSAFNKKHHFIGWDNDSIYMWDDGDEYE